MSNDKSDTPDSLAGERYDILIVDDMEVNLLYLEKMFTLEGYRVCQASDGVTALSIIDNNPPTLILLDIMMPNVDGLELCRQIKKHESTKDIPIIFISALNEPESIVKGFEAGAVDYVSKPFKIKEVIARVKTHMTISQLQIQLKNRNVQMQKEISERIEAEEKLKFYLEQLRNLAAHLQDIREDERQIIARDIHDDIGQSLTGLKIELSMLKNDVSEINMNLSPSITEGINTMMSIIENTVKSVRKLVKSLRPEILDDLSLLEAIKWIIEEVAKQNKNTMWIFKGNLEELNFSKEKSTAIFRIVQESLHNIQKHAKATVVEVSIAENNGTMELKISDDGIGFSESNLVSRESFGLISMRERAILLEGELNIISAPGNGTKLLLNVPLQ
ncbi:MAG: response regulator [Ignavibacteriaceae bacterium]